MAPKKGALELEQALASWYTALLFMTQPRPQKDPLHERAPTVHKLLHLCEQRSAAYVAIGPVKFARRIESELRKRPELDWFAFEYQDPDRPKPRADLAFLFCPKGQLGPSKRQFAAEFASFGLRISWKRTELRLTASAAGVLAAFPPTTQGDWLPSSRISGGATSAGEPHQEVVAPQVTVTVPVAREAREQAKLAGTPSASAPGVRVPVRKILRPLAPPPPEMAAPVVTPEALPTPPPVTVAAFGGAAVSGLAPTREAYAPKNLLAAIELVREAMREQGILELALGEKGVTFKRVQIVEGTFDA